MSSEEIRTLRRKLKKARENGKLQEISDCCVNLAAYLGDEEEHDEALKLYKESLTCCEKLENKVGAALAHRMITEECINLGFFEEALDHVTIFLKYAEDEGDKAEEQRGLVLKGHVYFTQAEYLTESKPREAKKISQLYEQSMDAYRKSFAICNSELHDISEKERLQMKSRLLQNKSLVLSRQNKLDYAQAHLIRAIKICTKEKLNDTAHICYLSLGDLFIKKGDYQKALIVYDRAFDLSHSTQKKRDSLVGKVKAYIFMEDYPQAKITLKKAYKLRVDEEIKKLIKHVACVIKLESNLCSTPDTDHERRKNLYKKLGDTFTALKSYKKSIKCYLNMLSCAQKADLSKNELIKCYGLLCKAFSNDQQYDKALFYSHQEVESLSKWAPEKTFKTYLRIAELHELNGSDFEEINFAYSKAKNKAQQLNNKKLQKKCLKRLINISENYNKPELMNDLQKELQDLTVKVDESDSSSDSGNESESILSTDGENNSEQSSDDLKDIMSDSDYENEEFDRPKERCKRTKFTIKRNEKGETDLHVAAIKGNYKKVKLLIDQGHPVNVRDTAGWTPLHEACNHGYVDIVNFLLDFGANINDKGGPSCDGTTPLHDAAINGQLEVIDTLIKRGASTLVLNDAGETPLQCLLAWKRNSALDSDEDAMFDTIVGKLKSPLDLEDIKRHLKMNKGLGEKKLIESKSKKNSNDNEIFDIGEKKTKRMKSPVSEYRETIELLRGKRQASRSELIGSSSSGNLDDDCFGNSRKRMKSACEEYKTTIDELRHRPKNSPSVSFQTKQRTAFIREEEYVDNCIMDNDEDEESEEEKEELEKSDDGNMSQKSEIEEEEKVFTQPRKKLKVSPTDCRKPSLEKEFESKPWLKSIPMDLLEDSFELPGKQNEDEDIFKSIAEVNSEPEIVTQTMVQNKSTDKIVDITVAIFNDKIKVPISQSDVDKLKIKWLTQELFKKYPNLQNPDNYISFKTQDGYIGEAEPLSAVGDREVECVVTKWKALPLSERYEKVCTETSHPDISSEVRAFGFKHTVQTPVVEMLKKSSKTRTFTLSNLKLSSLTLIPICKAVKYETFIQSLDLSNNYFGDKGIELIVKIFEKCIVEELNVSGCNITSTGLYHFSDALNGMNELSKNGLEVLNFSSNPVTDDAVAAISNIIEQLPNLRTLNIDYCELEKKISVNNSNSVLIIQGNKFENPHKRTGSDS